MMLHLSLKTKLFHSFHKSNENIQKFLKNSLTFWENLKLVPIQPTLDLWNSYKVEIYGFFKKNSQENFLMKKLLMKLFVNSKAWVKSINSSSTFFGNWLITYIGFRLWQDLWWKRLNSSTSNCYTYRQIFSYHSSNNRNILNNHVIAGKSKKVKKVLKLWRHITLPIIHWVID